MEGQYQEGHEQARLDCEKNKGQYQLKEKNPGNQHRLGICTGVVEVV